MRALLAALLMVIGLGPRACAGPLDGKQVSADARWLVHIDVDAIMAGEVTRVIGGLWLKLPAASVGLKNLSLATGIDPTEDLRSITIYGRPYTEPGAVVILRAEVDQKRLMVLLRRKADYRLSTHGEHELISWTENKGKEDEHTVTGCFHRPTVIVFGRDAAAVRKALDVLDGTSRGLSRSDPLFSANTPPGTMIQARATDFADVQQFKSPLVQESKFLLVALGEEGGETFAAARLVTKSAEVARQVQAIVKGFLALAKLQLASDEEALKILEAVEVSTEESTVSVECRGPTGDVAKLIERAWMKQLEPK